MRSRGFQSGLAGMLEGGRLTTAEILYHLPDYPTLLQSFTWQTLDEPPRFERLRAFLEHWERTLDAALHSVTVCHAALIGPARFRFTGREWRLE
ncbi:MAG: hypothetical protein INF91_08560 [Alphaproteobacteria bacterium]|nr:hypothetical protein [Alphaproteobacteria bacterium]